MSKVGILFKFSSIQKIQINVIYLVLTNLGQVTMCNAAGATTLLGDVFRQDLINFNKTKIYLNVRKKTKKLAPPPLNPV